MDVRWTVETVADGTTEVVVHGDVDMAVEEMLHAVLHDCAAAAYDRGCRVRINLTNVSFMDSAGLRSLMRLHIDHGGVITISEVSAPVARLFEVAGVVDWLLPARAGDPQDPSGS
jgi:anti-anti-sigma factor